MFLFEQHSQQHDGGVADAREQSDDPDACAQQHQVEQVVERRDAVAVGFAAPHVLRVATVLEAAEVSARGE